SNSSNSYSGGTVISGGTVSISNAGHLGNTSGAITLGSGSTSATLNITTGISRTVLNVTDGSSAGVINVASGQTFTLTNLNTASGTNNTTKFGKSGPGTLTLSGAGTYVGQIQIGEGNVIVSNNSGLGTNNSTVARGIDLGLNVGDVSQANNVSVLATNGITVPQSIYVAPNTTSATRTIGLSGASGTATYNNEVYLDGNLTVSGTGTVVLSGRLTNTGGLNSNATTVNLQHNAKNYSGTTTINSGSELRLNPSANATFSSQIVLNGGTLGTTGITASRTWTSSNTLNVTANSTLALLSATAHTLTFAASNGISWTAGATLNITGWSGNYDGTAGTGGRIFIGNNSSGLTSTQLAHITFFNGTNYYQATLLSTGELVPTSATTALYWG
ncbi:MAG: autotransporter-associated beta strand repeat-containing protein, partial [Dolichospermum sp.]